MSSFALDTDGDLLYENNRLSLTTGQEAIRQHLQVRFNFFLGEWVFDENLGVPYYQKILQKKPMYAVVAEVLKSVVLNTSGVIELITFKLDFDSDTRTTTLEFEAMTEEGILDFSQEIALF